MFHSVGAENQELDYFLFVCREAATTTNYASGESPGVDSMGDALAEGEVVIKGHFYELTTRGTRNYTLDAGDELHVMPTRHLLAADVSDRVALTANGSRLVVGPALHEQLLAARDSSVI